MMTIRAQEAEGAAALVGTVSGTRRFVDPSAREEDFDAAVREFLRAMHEYSQRSGRMFPTWADVLGVLQGLGYEKALGGCTATVITATTVGRSGCGAMRRPA